MVRMCIMASVGYPDFSHMKAGVGLWVRRRSTPVWVKEEVAAMRPGSVPRCPFAWNEMLVRYVKSRRGRKALKLFRQMQEEGVNPDRFTFVAVANACASVADLDEGRSVHKQIIENGYEFDLFVASSLVDMYAKCGSIDDARRLFEEMPTRDVVVWTAMLAGYVKCEQRREALQLYQRMLAEDVKPNTFTFVTVINACAGLSALEKGRMVHQQIRQSGCECDIRVGNCLVDMYAKCGSIDEAHRVFKEMPTRNVVSWTAMIGGYVKCEAWQNALDLFSRMQKEGITPDSVTFATVLSACCSAAALTEGRKIHAQVIQSGCESNVYVASSLVDMYAKCGSIENAESVFNKIPRKNVVSWTAMMGGYVKCQEGQKALDVFRRMQTEGLEPNCLTYSAALNACASVMALKEGRSIHAQVIERGLDSDVRVANGLVDMYAKCGSIHYARIVFDKMTTRDVASWNIMLGGFALHGRAKEARRLFDEMQEADVQMNDITFVCLLSAFSHAGLVDKGLHYFESMSSIYGVAPAADHYACVVDLLGRAGHLSKAEKYIKRMSSELKIDSTHSLVIAWRSLLSACRIHGNVELGERAAQRLIELDPDDAAGYVLMSDIFAAADLWDSRDDVVQMRKDRGVQKLSGRSWIEVDDQVHSFDMNDQAHNQLNEIQSELGRLWGLMQMEGYVPDTSFVLHKVKKEKKIVRLGQHSIKLAIAFGLLNTAPGVPLRIRKSSRLCGDCHTASKFISKIAKREIFIRDVNRFHHFKEGRCSCMDFW